jgi:hypothetical protein
MGTDCLNTLVGLSNRACDCPSGDLPSGYNESDSGYFLTDTEHGFPILDAVWANAECGEGSVWEVLENARTEAVRDFKSDLLQALNAGREQKQPHWKGLIGKTDGAFFYGGAVTGVQLRPRLRSRDAAFVVTAVHVGIETAGTYDLYIKSNDYTFTTVSESLTTEGGAWHRHELAEVVRLPFYVLHEESLRYSIELENAGSKVRNNKAFCCGGAPPWHQYFDWGGFSEASVSNEHNYCMTTFGGVAVEGYFDCAKLDWICNLEELNGLDFRDLIARCIQFKGAIKLMARVLESGRVNYWTVLSAEAIAAKRTRLQQMYGEYITWLVQNMPATISGCWGCRKGSPKVTTLSS